MGCGKSNINKVQVTEESEPKVTQIRFLKFEINYSKMFLGLIQKEGWELRLQMFLKQQVICYLKESYPF
jgi:hypothetical protein